jgi:hypothetical protein
MYEKYRDANIDGGPGRPIGRWSNGQACRIGLALVLSDNRLTCANPSKSNPPRSETISHGSEPCWPRNLGLALIALGVASGLVSILQYRRLENRLWSRDLAAFSGRQERPQWTPTVVVCCLPDRSLRPSSGADAPVGAFTSSSKSVTQETTKCERRIDRRKVGAEL